jgi:hypothetical protein
MNNTTCETIADHLLDQVGGGAGASPLDVFRALEKRIGAVWRSKGDVSMSFAHQDFGAADAAGVRAVNGKFTVDGLEAGAQERYYGARVEGAKVKSFRSGLLDWVN